MSGFDPREFKLAVKHKLIDIDMSQAELIRQVRLRTGMYLDDSYLNRIYSGKNHPAAIIATIREILELPE